MVQGEGIKNRAYNQITILENSHYPKNRQTMLRSLPQFYKI